MYVRMHEFLNDFSKVTYDLLIFNVTWHWSYGNKVYDDDMFSLKVKKDQNKKRT